MRRRQKKNEAIILRMTRWSVGIPDILNASRRKRASPRAAAPPCRTSTCSSRSSSRRGSMMKQMMGGGKRGRMRLPFWKPA